MTGELVVVPSVLSTMSAGLDDAAASFESRSSSPPSGGDLGEAGPALSGLMASFCAAGAVAAAEASVISGAVDRCTADFVGVDASEADRYSALRGGR